MATEKAREHTVTQNPARDGPEMFLEASTCVRLSMLTAASALNTGYLPSTVLGKRLQTAERELPSLLWSGLRLQHAVNHSVSPVLTILGHTET